MRRTFLYNNVNIKINRIKCFYLQIGRHGIQMKFFKFLLLSCCCMFLMGFSCLAADFGLYPAYHTGADNVTSWGYINKAGSPALYWAYGKAGVFDENGLAIVESKDGKTGVINTNGQFIVDYAETPEKVEFTEESIIFRYQNRADFYSLTGELLLSMDNVAGCFSDGLILKKSSSLWGYADASGDFVIEPVYKAASPFADGRAAVSSVEDQDFIINTSGNIVVEFAPGERVLHTLLHKNGLLFLQKDRKIALGTADGQHLTDFIYDDALEFEDGHARVAQNGLWGLIDSSGAVTVKPSYVTLSYMNDNLYYCRDTSGLSRVITAKGEIIYEVKSFSGFAPFESGVSWHTSESGDSILFFNENGNVLANLEGAENPIVLGTNIVQVTQGGETRYIRLSDNKVIYTPARSYELGGGYSLKSQSYQKYFGAENSRWEIEYPIINGFRNEELGKQINQKLKSFFMKGPEDSQGLLSVIGSYGYISSGRVAIFYADASCTYKDGSGFWNDSLAIDMLTGVSYSLSDLLLPDKEQELQSLVRKKGLGAWETARFVTNGVRFYSSARTSGDALPEEHSVFLSFEDMSNLINTNGACYMALTTGSVGEANIAALPFSDLQVTHWAYPYIAAAYQKGLMQGDGKNFAPDEKVSAAELCATLSRALRLIPNANPSLPTVDQSKWYAKQVNALYHKGLLKGLEHLSLDSPMERIDAMALIANVLLLQDPAAAYSASSQADRILSGFSDANILPPSQREAAAICVQAGLISGSDGKLRPHDSLSRAQIAKIVSMLAI